MAEVALTGQVGDSLRVAFRILDVEGGIARPRNLASATFAAKVRYGATSQADAAPDTLRVGVVDAANGAVVASLPADHRLPAGDYRYEVDCTVGRTTETVLHGALTISASLLP